MNWINVMHFGKERLIRIIEAGVDTVNDSISCEYVLSDGEVEVESRIVCGPASKYYDVVDMARSEAIEAAIERGWVEEYWHVNDDGTVATKRNANGDVLETRILNTDA